MKKLTTLFLGLSVAVGFTNANIDPQADQDAFINYFKKVLFSWKRRRKNLVL